MDLQRQLAAITLLEAGDVANDSQLGLLVLGLHGNDYWLWDALSVVAPLLVVTGSNALFGADRAVVVPYDPQFVLPSWYELPGMVTLEAARYGAAVVAPRWGTIEDYLGDACRYCEPGDPASIRRSIHAALEAGPLPQAADRAAQWTWERHAREVLAVYEAVLAGSDAQAHAVGA